MPASDIVDSLRPLVESEPGLSAMWVFGSVAKGLARADSDVDLGYLGESPTARESLRANRIEISGRLAVALGRDVQLVDLERADTALRMQVFRDGRPLFDRDPQRTRRLIERTLMEWFDWEHARKLHDVYLDQRFRVNRRG